MFIIICKGKYELLFCVLSICCQITRLSWVKVVPKTSLGKTFQMRDLDELKQIYLYLKQLLTNHTRICKKGFSFFLHFVCSSFYSCFISQNQSFQIFTVFNLNVQCLNKINLPISDGHPPVLFPIYLYVLYDVWLNSTVSSDFLHFCLNSCYWDTLAFLFFGGVYVQCAKQVMVVEG